MLAELDAVEGGGAVLFERAEVVTRSVVTCWNSTWPKPIDGFEPVDEVW